MPPLAETYPFAIEELTGDLRFVQLTGRALPYQGVGFAGRQRTKRTTYAGNPVATIQVLGPEYDNTTVQGMWKERFTAGAVAVSGADAVDTPEQIVALFESIRDAGQTVRVQWGPTVRVGIMVAFEATWLRPQDVSWSAEFEWSSDDSPGQTPRAAAPVAGDEEVRDTSTRVDDAVITDPSSISDAYREGVTTRTNATREQVGAIFSTLRAVRQGVSVTAEQVGAVAAAADTVRTEVEGSLGLLVDLPYTVAQTDDGVLQVLGCEAWRRTLAERDRSLRAACLRRARSLARQAIPGALAVVVMPGDRTLRDLALSYYGTADAWQVIADANGFASSRVAPGVVVIVPPPAASGGR